MKKNIDITIFRDKDFVYGKIKSIPNELRKKQGILIKDKGYSIIIGSWVELNKNILKIQSEPYKDYNNQYFCYQYNTEEKAIKVEKAFKKLIKNLEEDYSTPLLDNVEKEYLKTYIKPFKQGVKHIQLRKWSSSSPKCNIEILVTGAKGTSYQTIKLPYFKEGKMYAGLKPNKEYSLKELNLA